ncbi:MAG: YibE/F family protein [Actinobacteria bacterium]|nr:YibE/F family protein [Actinomycetota bacterium]
MAHAHSHGGDDEAITSPTIRRALTVAVVIAASFALIGLAVLWPREDPPPLDEAVAFSDRLDATVDAITTDPCQGTVEADGIPCKIVSFTVDSGVTAGEQSYLEMPVSTLSPDFDAGQGLVLGYNPDAPVGNQYFFLDVQRKQPLLVLAALFVFAVLALGRVQGFRALGALAVTGVLLMAFMLPAILIGRSPTAVALVGSAIIALAALYLTHGINERTTVALLGTFASLGLIGVLGAAFVAATRLSGLATEDAIVFQVASGGIDVRGLLLAGIIIGSLGVLDDVTVTQVSAVWELHQANPDYGMRGLYTAAIRIGRDHIASTVNTLVLAYAGAALPLLLLYRQAAIGLTDVANGEVIAVEIVRTLVGSIGLVASVPITTALAALVISRSGTTGGRPVALAP